MKLSLSLIRSSFTVTGLLLALSSSSVGAQEARTNRLIPPQPINSVRAISYNQCTNGNCNQGSAGSGVNGGTYVNGGVNNSYTYPYGGGPYGPGANSAYGAAFAYGHGGGWGNGSCPNGNCHGGWGGNCHGGNCLGGCLFGNCLHGLAHGKAFVRPPAVWGIPHVSGTYKHYWNPSLTGGPITGGGMAYPMVYHPTDTTQLGFSYQHVPRWQYRPEMLPPAPVPNWPLGMSTAYPYGGINYGVYGEVTYPSNGVVTPVQPVDPVITSPVQPADPAPAETPEEVDPAPAPVPGVAVPEPEAAVFPQRVRR